MVSISNMLKCSECLRPPPLCHGARPAGGTGCRNGRKLSRWQSRGMSVCRLRRSDECRAPGHLMTEGLLPGKEKPKSPHISSSDPCTIRDIICCLFFVRSGVLGVSSQREHKEHIVSSMELCQRARPRRTNLHFACDETEWASPHIWCIYLRDCQCF